tara:strand:+ start:328 stop:525 length:198 start_codon:yes stop_codon:yes gene_type:complete
MVKKINLTDTSSPSTATPTTEAGGTDIGPILDLLGQVDWKLWEIYKTCKRFEKLFEADQVTLDDD